jgi:hypothetical protein
MAEMVAGGLGGMAVYHYWFYTHQELDAFERTLLGGRGRADLPWFLVWASEGWSRRWMRDPSPILTLSSDPTDAQIEAHCCHLARCFEHPSYFRWHGKPLLVWYHLAHFEHPQALVDRYRRALALHGVEIAVGHFIKSPSDAGLARVADVSYLFEPRLYFGFQRMGRGSRAKQVLKGIKRLIGEYGAQRLLLLADRLQQKGQIYSVADYLAYLGSEERSQFMRGLTGSIQEVVSPGWNNAPRYESRFTALNDIAPKQVAEQVCAAAAQTPNLPPLINAWNEWSEGAAIEPCAYLGTQYLDAIASAGLPGALQSDLQSV